MGNKNNELAKAIELLHKNGKLFEVSKICIPVESEAKDIPFTVYYDLAADIIDRGSTIIDIPAILIAAEEFKKKQVYNEMDIIRLANSITQILEDILTKRKEYKKSLILINELAEALAKLSDENKISILHKKEGYVIYYSDVAREIVEGKGLDIDNIASYNAQFDIMPPEIILLETENYSISKRPNKPVDLKDAIIKMLLNEAK